MANAGVLVEPAPQADERVSGAQYRPLGQPAQALTEAR
jgi:hypothetical protein